MIRVLFLLSKKVIKPVIKRTSLKLPVFVIHYRVKSFRDSGDMNTRVFLSGQTDAHVIDDAPHYQSVVQLRKVSHLLSPIHVQQHNGSVSSYHLDGVHDDMSPVCWSPGEHGSPEGKGKG